MSTQNFENHVRIDTGYHRVLYPILLLTLIGSGVNLYHALGDHQRLYSASLIVVILAAMIAMALYARIYALRAQDRAIRAEENLRHYVLTGKLLDSRLTMRQIVALRFASDGEFPALAAQAAAAGTDAKEIKRAVKHWKADENRV
ncbi:MAG: hypothetical protein IT163_01750 [Bryobacterales bacterium]|nr:hypothetical protein [Bryobacterales bacterium]